MANQTFLPQGGSTSQMLINAAVDMKAVEALVVDMYPGLHIWNMLANKYDAVKKSEGKTTYQMDRIGNIFPGTTVASNSLSNGVLTVTFTDSQFSGFRNGDILRAANSTLGYVISATAGSVQMTFQASPTSGTTAFDATTDFIAGQAISWFGDARNLNNPNMVKDRLVTEPIPFYNNIGMMSETAAYTGVEAWEMSYLAKVGGKTYQMDAQLKQAMLRISMAFAVRNYSSIRSNQNGVILQDGFEQQIKNGGGYINSHSGAPTESSVQQFIDGMIENGGSNGNKFAVVCGNRYIGGFQSGTLASKILYAGNTNTFKITDGIDGYYYAYNGATVEFWPDPLFLNGNAYPRSASTTLQQYNNTAFWLNVAPVQTNNGEQTFLTQRYYGPTDMGIIESNGALTRDGQWRRGPSNGQLEYSETVVYNKTLQLENPAACGIDVGYN